ncbi:WD repeat-containing protein 18-like [Littorina saxatilis]|uniref:WD repeat-containing protein 18 n=1 Tax=Littorina saxatilis TaxID=31220 RepID=A0AAN9GA91_9CAEN
MTTHAGHEVLLTTDALAQPWSISVWDTDTGSSVSNFKGQAVAPRCLCLRGSHTLIGATENKPVLQLWPLSKKEDSQQKLVCPGKVSTITISPDGLFCIAAIAEKVYIWEMSAGGLLSVLSDFDEVKVIRFTDDGSQFVTGSCGGSLLIWDFATVVSRTAPKAKGSKPRHRRQAHSAEITDIHVGCGGPAARVVTCSTDFSCKLWDLISGELMKTIIYEEEVHSVIMDQAEMSLFAGLESGDIRCSPLYGQVSQLEEYAVKNVTKAGERTFRSHKDSVTCLALSSDGMMLASGSADGTAKLWSMQEENSLLDIQHGGPVTNVLFMARSVINSAQMHQGPAITLQNQMGREEGGRGRVINITISDNSEWPERENRTDVDRMLGLSSPPEAKSQSKEEDMDTTDEIGSLRQEVEQLKQVNKDLYNFLAKKIISSDGGKSTSE